MRNILLLALALGVSLGDNALANVCRGIHGQFVPCPKIQAPLLCRDAKTKQPAKCKAPGTEPAPSAIRRFNG
jgi:hypothetical protein